MNNDLKLYKFCWETNRQGSVEGLFIASKQKVEKHIGKDVYFGEILGKHSNVYGTLDLEDLVEIDVPENVLNWLIENLGYDISGYNPLNYISANHNILDKNV